MNGLARFALNMPDEALTGDRWCEPCGTTTNHTTRQHDDAERAQEDT